MGRLLQDRRWLAVLLIGWATGVAACGAGGFAPSPTPGLSLTGTTAKATRLQSTETVTISPPITPSATGTSAPSPTPEPTLTPTFTPTPAPLPTPDADARNRVVRLPVLMYHYVEPWPVNAGEIRRNLTVRPEGFAAQMQYLHDHGYVTVSLYDLLYALTLGRPLPPKAVVLTFDDGYRDLMQYAVPVMQPYGYTGTVFVITELMDKGLDPYLTWPQAESLYAMGWKIEPHTKTHDELAGQSRDFQLYQMLGSVQTVQAHIGVTPRFFDYPSGKYDDVTLQLDHELGLWGAVTVEFGRTHTLDSLYTLTRVRVGGQDTLQQFVNMLEGDLQQP
jgi:peptidoglycan/xylan/chitin deacetylase (PgdA/CDA1 family)